MIKGGSEEDALGNEVGIDRITERILNCFLQVFISTDLSSSGNLFKGIDQKDGTAHSCLRLHR